VAFREPAAAAAFTWPEPSPEPPPTVGDTLRDLVSERGSPGAADWAAGAQGTAPTITAGSRKHGGPDLGPSQTKAAFRRRFSIDATGAAETAPGPDGTY
jgi:DNA (cytosine-5)-methyltransferase 1